MPALSPTRTLLALKKNATTLSVILKGVDHARAVSARDGSDGWTVLEVLCHLRDYENIFMSRNKLVLEADEPALPVYNPMTLAAENRYAEQDFLTVWNEWLELRRQHLDLLSRLTPEAWNRKGAHPTWGIVPILEMATITALHDGDHTEQIIRALGLSDVIFA